MSILVAINLNLPSALSQSSSLSSPRRLVIVTVVAMLWLYAGCTNQEEVVPLTIPDTAASTVGMPNGLRELSIGVKRFEDRRHETTLLGVKAGRFGSLDSYNFVVSGADLGQAVADALIRYLAGHGGRASAIRMGAPAMADVIISGEIIDLAADAKSDWLSTRVTAKATLLIEAENQVDGGRIRMTVGASDARSVSWFAPSHAQSLVNQVLTESYAKWNGSIKVEGRKIVPK